MNRRLRQERSYLRFWVLFAALSAMIFVRYGLQIGIPRVLALVPIVAIALLGDKTELIAICMCLIPFHESLDFYYALVLVIAIYVFKNFRQIRINASFFLMLLMVLWELLHCLAGDFSPVTFVVSLAPIIALVVFLCSDFSDLDYAFVVRAVAAAAMVVCVTMLVQLLWISRFDLASFFVNLRRLGALSEQAADRLQLSGGLIQTNSLGVICVMITATLLQLRFSGQSKRSDTYVMLTLLIFGTLTASRTFLVCLALMIFLVLMGQKGVVKKLRYLGIAILALGFLVLLFSIFFTEQLEYFVSRFFEADITTGRDDLMVVYHRFIMDHMNILFFGVGLQNHGDKLVTHYRVANNVPHNSIQEIAVIWGIPGLLLMAALIFWLCYQAYRKMGRRKLINYIPVIIILFKSVAGQLLTSNYSMLALAFGYLNLVQDLNDDPKRIKQ